MNYRGFYISQMEDFDEDDNAECVYCEVYTDDSLDEKIDFFVIHHDKCYSSTAEEEIKKNIDEEYDNYVELKENKEFI